MGALPKITVVTPSYNQAEYLETTIRSVLDQGYPNLEYIVIDGGSTDGSVEIIKKYASRLTYWVSEKDRGQSHAINKGFARGTGEIFAWINSDDYFHPGAFAAAARAFAADSECGMVTGISDCLDGTDMYRVPVAEEVTHELYAERRIGIAQHATFFKAALFREVGGLDEALHYVMDLDLWIKMLAKTSCVSLRQALAVCTIHDEMKSKDAKNRTLRYLEADIAYARGGSCCMRRELGRVLLFGRLTGVRFATPDEVVASFAEDPRGTIGSLMRPMSLYAALQDVKQTVARTFAVKQKTKVAVIADDAVDRASIRKTFVDAGAAVSFFNTEEKSQANKTDFDYVVCLVPGLELVDDERTVCLGASIGLDRNVAGQCARFAEKLHDWRNYAPVSRERELAAVKAVAEGRHE